MVGTTSLEVRLYEAGVRQRTQGGAAVQELLQGLPPDELRRAALWIHRNQCRGGADRVTDWSVSWLAERRLGWSVSQAEELLERLVGVMAIVDPAQLLQEYGPLMQLPLAAAREVGGCDRALMRAARKASLSAWGDQTEGSENAATREVLDRLIGPETPDATGLPWAILDDEDAYGPRMRAEHPELLAAAGVRAFLEHCAALGTARPTRKWQKAAGELLAAVGRGDELVRALLDGAAEQTEHLVVAARSTGVHREWGLVGERNEAVVRGALWAAADLTGAWVVPAVGAVALNAGTGTGGSGGVCRSARLASAGVAFLGACEGERASDAVRWLGRLKGTVRNRTVVKGIGKALEAVAGRAGLTPSMLRERGTPAHGLDARGMREEALGEYTAVLAVREPGVVSLSFHGPQGRVLKSAPKPVRERHGELLASLRAATKELRTLLASERARLEDHLAAGTTWPTEDWERYYIDHPVTGAAARALLWEVDPDGDGRWTAGLPERTGGGWALAGADGTAVPVGPGALLRLWHPVLADGEEIEEWRAELTGRELRQPFKQGFREVYRLAPGEVGTAPSTDRFAGHILRYGRARALMAERGWSGDALGYFSGGGSSAMVRELPRPGELPVSEGTFWRSRLVVELVDAGSAATGVAYLCSTGQVRFERRAASAGARGPWEGAALTDVPAPLRSEALRDVDLFVGVASIGADPEWRDRGEPRAHDGYWESWSLGEPSEPARIRRETLARLLPRTRIADRTELTDRFLRVRGELRAYRIHLGSGHVLMEPDGTRLPVVADPGAAGAALAAGAAAGGEKVFLPFEEEDGLLSVILSKAFLLADDARITDRTITARIRQGLS
ncbi:DUF4132 domain-containing protein [Streptomyces sp. Je 1-79]|uniref:DUF4132 domain-containing protein n=1 Tax=Streptomyces sp. Je 1-79 TaxID=2943847 RepID=UPI0021A6E7DE|nr:DUF4132 domain-containing protein [Streptomyces sp. Je 1-79]MCT4355669.1 DUF4132 domain-containing protein [Streptomyces sp. Je 1-79]